MKFAFPGICLAIALILSIVLVSSLRETSEIASTLKHRETDNYMQRFSITDDSGAELVLLRPHSLSLREFLEQIAAVSESAPKKDTWTSGGNTYMVITPRKIGEHEDDWCMRHEDLVEASQEIYPPD